MRSIVSCRDRLYESDFDRFMMVEEEANRKIE